MNPQIYGQNHYVQYFILLRFSANKAQDCKWPRDIATSYDVLLLGLWRSARIVLERGTTSVIPRTTWRIRTTLVSSTRRARCLGAIYVGYIREGRPHAAHFLVDTPIQN